MNFSTKARAALSWRRFAIAILLLLIRPGHALVVPIDGSARVGLVLVSESTIVCSTEVTPNSQHELFGLDARTGRVQWRAQTPRILTKGVSDSVDTFLLIARDVLQKRSLLTGKVFAPVSTEATTIRRSAAAG